MIAADENQL